jgi:hypothetical protein
MSTEGNWPLNQTSVRQEKCVRLKIYTYAAATWLAFVAITYGAGWSIGWIRRGFKAT